MTCWMASRHCRVRLPRCRRFPMPVKSRATHAAQLAHSFHAEAALPGPLRDQRADRFPSTFMRRKASPKKSSSNSCCPTLRSSSAIRFRAANSSPRRRGFGSTSCDRCLLPRPASALMRQTAFAQRRIPVLPHIQPLPSDSQFLGHSAHALSGQNSSYCRQFQLHSVLRLLRFLS